MKIAAFYENIAEGARASGVPLEEALARLKDAGLSLLCLTPESWERDGKVLGPVLARTGIGIDGLHAVCDFAREPGTERYREILGLASSLGAGNVLLIPGFLTTGDTGKAVLDMREGMRRAAPFGAEHGMPVLMEDYDGLLAPYNSIAGLAWFLDAVPELGCAFDTGNFCMYHEDELRAFRRFRDRIVTVHLKDRSPVRVFPGDSPKICADRKEIYPSVVGQGTIRIREILEGLREQGYGGNVIVEHYDTDPLRMLGAIEASVRTVRAFPGLSE